MRMKLYCHPTPVISHFPVASPSTVRRSLPFLAPLFTNKCTALVAKRPTIGHFSYGVLLEIPAECRIDVASTARGATRYGPSSPSRSTALCNDRSRRAPWGLLLTRPWAAGRQQSLCAAPARFLQATSRTGSDPVHRKRMRETAHCVPA